MRTFIPLDLRNIKDFNVRTQFRRLSDYLLDLASSLASDDLVVQAPDNITIDNSIVESTTTTTTTGEDPLDLVYFDDFIADPETDPSPGASGAIRIASSGSGSGITNAAADADSTALGVWKLNSAAVVGAAHAVMSPTDNVTFNLTLAPGITIGFRIKIDSTAFTRGLFSVGFTDANTSGSNSQQGTKRAAFVIWVADADYFTAAGLGTNIAIFEAADGAGLANYVFVNTSVLGSTLTDFINVRMVVRAEKTIDCYVNGVLKGTLSSHVPASTVKLALRIRQQTNGSTNPGVSQLSYIDRVFVKATDLDRGTL